VIIGEGRTLASGSIDALRGEGQTGVSLELDTAPDEVAAMAAKLQGAGFVTTADGRYLTVEGDNDDEVFDAARDACVEAEIGIVRLSRRRLTLEDVFLERLG
jgi:hypothetical protein